MPNRRLRFAAVLAAVGAFAFPAAASAGPFSEYGFLVGELNGERVQPLSPSGASFILALYEVEGSQNTQRVTGTIAGSPFVGFLAAHDYDRADDHVTYTLRGSVDPNGGTPPQDVLLGFEVVYDREANANKVQLSGTVGGQPAFGWTRYADVPTLYQLSPVDAPTLPYLLQ